MGLVFGLNAGPTPVSVHRRPDGVLAAGFVAPQVPRLQPSPLTPQEVGALVGLSIDDFDLTVPLNLADAGGTVFLVGLVRSVEALGRSHPAGRLPSVVGIFLAAATPTGWQTRMFAPAAGGRRPRGSGDRVGHLCVRRHAPPVHRGVPDRRDPRRLAAPGCRDGPAERARPVVRRPRRRDRPGPPGGCRRPCPRRPALLTPRNLLTTGSRWPMLALPMSHVSVAKPKLRGRTPSSRGAGTPRRSRR